MREVSQFEQIKEIVLTEELLAVISLNKKVLNGRPKADTFKDQVWERPNNRICFKSVDLKPSIKF